MALEPIDLLKERLSEMNNIESDDSELNNLKIKYLSIIRFLELHGFDFDKRKKLLPLEEFYINKQHQKTNKKEVIQMFNISYGTLNRILNEKY